MDANDDIVLMSTAFFHATRLAGTLGRAINSANHIAGFACAESAVARLQHVAVPESDADGGKLGESLDERICARFLQWELEVALDEEMPTPAKVPLAACSHFGPLNSTGALLQVV
jgi:hypothetical protein